MQIKIKKLSGKPLLVHFGGGGHSIYFAKEKDSTVIESGYDSPDNFFEPSKWWAHDYMTQRDSSQFNGVLWLDIRQVIETSEGYSYVINGPIVDVTLKDGQVLSPYQGIHNNLENIGMFDGVSPRDYVKLWQKQGAAGGIIENGKFIQQEISS